MRTVPSAALRARRRELLASLPSLARVMRGSLVVAYKRCGRAGCHCAGGTGHGPKHYLSVSAAGQRPKLNYVAHGDDEQVAECVANFRAVRSALNEICAINTELLRRHEDLG